LHFKDGRKSPETDIKKISAVGICTNFVGKMFHEQLFDPHDIQRMQVLPSKRKWIEMN